MKEKTYTEGYRRGYDDGWGACLKKLSIIWIEALKRS